MLMFSAEHFQALLASNSPQTSSREAASQWGCHIHNKVNESLNKVCLLKLSVLIVKKIFDCSSILEVYKCGCEEDEKGDNKNDSGDKGKVTKNNNNKAVVDSSRSGRTHLEFENSGLTRGG